MGVQRLRKGQTPFNIQRPSTALKQGKAGKLTLGTVILGALETIAHAY